MFQSIFNSLSGMFSFSRSLNTVSNNVTNMNTPGFRGSDTFFSNIAGGRGTQIAGEGLRTGSGDIRETGNETDLAIQGSGFFVLTDDAGNVFYTRAGQFRFNEEGLLVDSVSGYRVMGFDNNGALTVIDKDNYRLLPAAATTAVRINGNLAPVIDPNAPPVTTRINSITIFDAAGATHTLTATFVSNTAVTPGSFLVTITNEAGATIGSGEVRFGGDGRLLTGFNTLTATLPVNGTNQAITFNFGAPGNGPIDGIVSFGGTSNATATVTDGHAVLGLRELKFTEKGVMEFIYSDSEKRTGPQVALAVLPNESSLSLSGGRLISGIVASEREIGRPGDGRFGRISGRSLELSNIDLTQEFADMIIIQRGYQASSRVMTVSNEMLEQLYNSTRGG